MEDYGLRFMNKTPTWYRGNQKSLIDHVATNMHTHIEIISTYHAGVSDHCIVNFNHRTAKNVILPNYHLTQNFDNSSHLDAELLMSFNTYLQQMWSIQDIHHTRES